MRLQSYHLFLIFIIFTQIILKKMERHENTCLKNKNNKDTICFFCCIVCVKVEDIIRGGRVY